MKKVFKDKRIKIVLISCLTVLLVVLGGIYAARTIARNSSIGEDAAQNFAYLDAEVESKDVNKCNVKFQYMDGTYVYIVKFTTDQAKYNYVVKASNGIILKKNVTKIKAKDKKSDKKKDKKKSKKHKKSKKKSRTKSFGSDETENVELNGIEPDETNTSKVKATVDDNNSDTYITVDKAKSIAKRSSGESSVIFTMTQIGTDNGLDVYYIYFTAGDNEYRYTINAKTGGVVGSQKISHKDQSEDSDDSDDDSNEEQNNDEN